MPTITVSDDVLEKIHALREAADEAEDAVLRRVLETAVDRESRLRAYERAEQDISSTN